MIRALHLPPDSWSASLLSFAKFFSLPLEGAFVGAIRQQVLRAEGLGPEEPRPGAGGEPEGSFPAGDGAEAPFREALSLGAIAAAAKGVELLPEALAEYARALLRGRRRGDRSPGGRAGDSGAKDRDSGDAPGAGEGEIPGRGAAGGRGPAREGPPASPAERRGTGEPGENPGKNPGPEAGKPEAEEPGTVLGERITAAQGPLLGLLNKLPEQGGSRWIVLPFSLDKGLEGCLRILLRPPGAGSGTQAAGPGQTGPVERLALDIARGEEYWAVTLWPEGTAGAPAAASPVAGPAPAPGSPQAERPSPAAGPLSAAPPPLPPPAPLRPPLSLDLSRYPAFRQAEGEALRRDLAELLGLAPGHVRIREEFPPLAEDCRDWTLPSLDKEV